MKPGFLRDPRPSQESELGRGLSSSQFAGLAQLTQEGDDSLGAAGHISDGSEASHSPFKEMDDWPVSGLGSRRVCRSCGQRGVQRLQRVT
jgi:hypothetical protein